MLSAAKIAHRQKRRNRMFFDIINLKKIRKAIVYLAVIVIAVGFQTLVLSRISIFGAKAMAVPVLVVAIGMFEGGVWGGMLGIVTGVLLDDALAGNALTFTVLMPIVGFLSGFLSELCINRKIVPCIALCAAALLAAAVCQALPLWLSGGARISALLPIVGLQALYSMPFSPAAFLVCRTLGNR